MRNENGRQNDAVLPPTASWADKFGDRRLPLPKKFGPDLLLVTAGRIATIAAQLAFVKLYAHLFSPAQLGSYFFWQTISYSMTALVFVPLDQFQQVNIHRYLQKGFSLRSFIPLNILPILLFLALGAAASIGSSLYFGQAVATPFYAVTFAVSVHLSSALRNACNNLGHRALAVIFGLIDAFLRVGFLFALSSIFRIEASSILLTSSLAGAAVALLILPYFTRRRVWGDGKIMRPSAVDFATFAWPITAGAGLNWLQIQSSRFLVPLGYAEVIGIYAAVSAIGAAGMQAASGIFQMMFLPELYQTFGGSMRKYLLLGASTIAVVLVISAPISHKLVQLAASPAFVPYSYCVLFGIAIEGGNLLIGGLNIYMQVHHRTVLGLIPAAVGFTVSIVPLYLLYRLGNISPLTLGLSGILAQAITVCINVGIFIRLRRRLGAAA